MGRSETDRVLRHLFRALDWRALGDVYCDEGGEAFWAEHRGKALRLGLRWADALLPRELLVESSFRAGRDGLAATVWHDGALRPVRERITAAVERLRDEGHTVDHVHLTHLNPLPTKLAEMVQGYEHIMVPELNMGQLIKVLRAEYLIDAKPISKVTGLPFTGAEIVNAVTAHIGNANNGTGTNGAH